jgi:hypothetical protein
MTVNALPKKLTGTGAREKARPWRAWGIRRHAMNVPAIANSSARSSLPGRGKPQPTYLAKASHYAAECASRPKYISGATSPGDAPRTSAAEPLRRPAKVQDGPHARQASEIMGW